MKNKKYILFIKNNSLIIFLVLMIVYGSIFLDRFLTITNILNVLRASSIFGVMALGLTFVMIAGEIDISVGAILSLTSVVVVAFQNYYNYLIPHKYNFIPAIIMVLIVGLIIGSVNGFFVGFIRANSVIITIGMLSIIEIIGWLYGKKRFISVDADSSFLIIGKGNIFNIPVPIFIFFGLAFISYLILSRTSYGKYVYATGSDEKTARVLGIETKKVKYLTFVISGIFCSIAGLVLASRMAGSQAFVGTFYLFDAITAAILGGISLKGGRGSIGNTVVAVLVLGFLANILIFSGFEWASQQFFKGLLLIIAILVNTFLNIDKGGLDYE